MLVQKNNKSGYTGVHWEKSKNQWGAEITINGKSIFLGRFNNIEDAIDARKKAEEKYGIPDKIFTKEEKKVREKERSINQYQKKKETITKHRKKNRDKINSYGRDRNLKLKLAAINEYGGKCDCCGEDKWELLNIDHSNNDGAKHRKESGIRAGGQFFNWLKKNNYPKDLGLRVLCWNCNCSRGLFGYCPHEKQVYIMQDWE